MVDGGSTLIAKFSAQNDVYSVVRAEFVAMRLAALAGLDVAPVRLAHAAQKDVLLVERFDRVATNRGMTRRPLVSALTMLGLDEMMARYASYQDLAEIVRRRFTRPAATLREMFGRIMFNVLCGNTDDHARNHAAFWDGEMLTLTPAYDVCPQGRTGQEASQAMLIVGEDRRSQLTTCFAAAPAFGVSAREAVGVAEAQLEVFRTHWTGVCDEAGLSEVERRVFVGRQILNPFAFHGAGRLAALADDVRSVLLSG